MISSGAKVSRYLIQSVIGHYTKSNVVKHIRGPWCRSMKFTSFAHWVNLGASRYGDAVEVTKGKDDAALIENYIVLKSRALHDSNISHETLEARWVEVREIFEKYEFVPFDEKVRAYGAIISSRT
jgi:hypothetical protein